MKRVLKVAFVGATAIPAVMLLQDRGYLPRVSFDGSVKINRNGKHVKTNQDESESMIQPVPAGVGVVGPEV